MLNCKAALSRSIHHDTLPADLSHELYTIPLLWQELEGLTLHIHMNLACIDRPADYLLFSIF